jgi:16S rRNA G527 N7-methylase RsmG
MDIYRSHAVEYTEAELERKKPDNSLLEEIDRKTRFLEEMSEELKKKTQKNKKDNIEAIESATGQNRLLINALRELRTTSKANGTELRDTDRAIQNLNLEIKRMENEKESKAHARKI